MGANISYPDGSKPGAMPMTTQTRAPGRYSQNPDADMGSHKEKKKRLSKLNTLRKKLVRSRRHSRSFDHAKVVRDYTSSWSVRELNALVEEYEALAVEKEIALHASLARAHARSYKEDLSLLFDSKICTDIDLIYKGTCFPAHRAILSVRCSFFRNLLSKFPDFGAQVPVQIRTVGVDLTMFSSLLRYLYTGDFHVDRNKLDMLDVLVQLGNEFGIPNPLDQDLRTLLECSQYSDTRLCFTSDGESSAVMEEKQSPTYKAPSCRADFPCHKAVLAARSPFFRSILLRRGKNNEKMESDGVPSQIVLDESVIPKRYVNVLLSALYLDVVDLSQIIRTTINTTSLSEVQAMVAGKPGTSNLEEAMELYQIGQFIDFPNLAQCCEDLIIESLSLENLVSILQWSSEPHGSAWVCRQAMNFLQEEFLQVVHSPVLLELSHSYLLQAISSDFLQTGELDVLTAVMKWGEHQLMKRMEEREPNLVAHTAHSVSKKGIRKRDLPDTELKELLHELLPCVRSDHIIPPGHETLQLAIRRHLLSTPPSHMLIDEGAGTSPAVAWVRAAQNTGGAGVSVVYVRPRLFTPYQAETKALLEEQLAQVQENDMVRLRSLTMPMPDTLYMIDEASRISTVHCSMPVSHVPNQTVSPTGSAVDIIAGTIPVPDQQTLKALLCREHALQHCDLVQRAFTLPCLDRYAVCSHIQHQVVREFGLPDTAVELLQSARLYTVNNCTEEHHDSQHGPVEMSHVYSHSVPASVGIHGTLASSQQQYVGVHHYIHQHSTPAKHAHIIAHNPSPPQSPRILAAPHSHPVLLSGARHKMGPLSRAVSCPSGHAPSSQHGHAPPPVSCSPLIYASCSHPRSPAMSPACKKTCQGHKDSGMCSGSSRAMMAECSTSSSSNMVSAAAASPVASTSGGTDVYLSALATAVTPVMHTSGLPLPPQPSAPGPSTTGGIDVGGNTGVCSQGGVLCPIPDIAMATSSLAQLTLQDHHRHHPHHTHPSSQHHHHQSGGGCHPPGVAVASGGISDDVSLPTLASASAEPNVGVPAPGAGGDLHLDLGDGGSHTNSSTVYI